MSKATTRHSSQGSEAPEAIMYHKNNVQKTYHSFPQYRFLRDASENVAEGMPLPTGHGYTYVLSLLNIPLIFQSIPPIYFVTEYQISLGQELTDRKVCILTQPDRYDILRPCSSFLPLSYLVWKLRRRISTLKALLFFFHPVSWLLLAPKHQQRK